MFETTKKLEKANVSYDFTQVENGTRVGRIVWSSDVLYQRTTQTLSNWQAKKLYAKLLLDGYKKK